MTIITVRALFRPLVGEQLIAEIVELEYLYEA